MPVDTLILDVDTGPGLGSAVLRYRLNRQNVRIILLAIEREYGDAEVARVAQAGSYDIVTDISKLQQVLDREPSDIAAAAARRWAKEKVGWKRNRETSRLPKEYLLGLAGNSWLV